VEQALEKYRQAYELSSSPNAQLGVGRCLKDLGRRAEAYEQLEAAQREATERAGSDESYVKTRDAAAALLATLEPKIGKLVIAVTGGGDAVTVRVGDARIAAERIGTPIPLEPQKGLVVSATAPDRLPAERTVEIRAGRTTTVSLELKTTAAGPSGGAQGESGRDEPGADKSPPAFGPLRIGGLLVAVLVGGGGVVTFGVTGSMANARQATLRDAGCPRCDESFQSTLDQGKTLQTVANVGLGVGIAGLVGGAVMMIFGGPLGTPDGTTTQTEPSGPTASWGPDGVAVGYGWRY
jgi:hypothetical protein